MLRTENHDDAASKITTIGKGEADSSVPALDVPTKSPIFRNVGVRDGSITALTGVDIPPSLFDLDTPRGSENGNQKRQ